MYSYTFSKDDTDKVTQKTQDYSNMLDDFKKIDDKYNLTTDSVTFEKQTFTKPSDEEIQKQAQNSLENYKNTSLENIDKEYKEKSAYLQSQIEDAQSSANKQKEETKDLYSQQKEDLQGLQLS